MPTQQEIDAQRAATSAVNSTDTQKAAAPAVAQVAAPTTAPVGRTLSNALVANQQDTAGKTDLKNVYGLSQATASNASDQLSKAAGYNISEALLDPSRSAEIKAAVEKYKATSQTAPTSVTTPSKTTPTGANVASATANGAASEATSTADLRAQSADAAQKTAQAIAENEKIVKDAAELSKGQTYADAIKSTKETAEAQAKINDLQAQNAKIAANANIRAAKDSLNTLTQSHAYLAGALGQPVSSVGLDGLRTEVDRAQQKVSDIIQISENLEAAQKIGNAEQAKSYSEKIASLKKQLNAEVSGSIQQALVNLGKLDQLGDLQSPEAIVKARSDILEGLGKQYQNLTTATAAKLKLLNDTQEQEYKMKQDKAAVDYNLSNKTGKMVNKFGEPVLVGGKEVAIPKDKQVHSSQMVNGNMVTLFSDGTTQTTKAYDVTPYGNIDLQRTSKMGPVTGYVYDANGAVAVGPDGKPLKYSPEAVYDVVKNTDGSVVYHNKADPKESFATDSLGTITAVNGVPVPKRTEIRSDNYEVMDIAGDVADGSKGGQCTVFARKQLEKAGEPAWINEGLKSDEDDTVAFKASKTNTSVPSIGSLVALNNGTKYGHWGVVTGIGSDGTVTYKSSNENGDEKVTTNSFQDGDSRVIGYYNPNLPKKPAVGMEGTSKISEADISRLTRLTSGKTASDKERVAAGKVLEEVGGDMNEAIKKISGFNVKDKALGDQAIDAISRLGLTVSDVNAPAIAANLNSGNTKAAASNIERSAFDSDTGKKLDLANKDSDYRELFKNYSQIMDKVEKNKGKIGVLSGRWSDVKRKLAGDPELQSLVTQMTSVFAKLRKSFAGSAVTETEMAALADYISGKTTEPIDNLTAKLTGVMKGMDNEYQSARTTAGLPELSDESQINDRSSLYFGSTKGAEGVKSTESEDDIWANL